MRFLSEQKIKLEEEILQIKREKLKIEEDLIASRESKLLFEKDRNHWRDKYIEADKWKTEHLKKCPLFNKNLNEPPEPVPEPKWENMSFFKHVKSVLKRDYTLIIDKSVSMVTADDYLVSAETRWDQTRKGLEFLAPHITEADPDGVTVYFFSSGPPIKYDNVNSATAVSKLFSTESPSGSTDLAGVLKLAFQEHFNKGRPETMLILTDGLPDDPDYVKSLIIHNTKSLENEFELSMSFIQIGSDPGATKFLTSLDEELVVEGAKYDIVDTVTIHDLNNMSFSELVHRSIAD